MWHDEEVWRTSLVGGLAKASYTTDMTNVINAPPPLLIPSLRCEDGIRTCAP